MALDARLYPHHLKFFVVRNREILRTDCLWEATRWEDKRECEGELKSLQVEGFPHRVAIVLEGG